MLFLLQQTAMIGIFVALDIFLYYAFWELSLVPMAILIAMFGRDRGPRAALKFFVYTFLPSALLLVAIIWLYAKQAPSTSSSFRRCLAAGRICLRRALVGLPRVSRRLCGQGSGFPAARLAGGRH